MIKDDIQWIEMVRKSWVVLYVYCRVEFMPL